METVTLPNDCCEVMNKWWEAGQERDERKIGKEVREEWREMGREWERDERHMGGGGSSGEWDVDGQTGRNWVKMGHDGQAHVSCGLKASLVFLLWTNNYVLKKHNHLGSGDILSDSTKTHKLQTCNKWKYVCNTSLYACHGPPNKMSEWQHTQAIICQWFSFYICTAAASFCCSSLCQLSPVYQTSNFYLHLITSILYSASTNLSFCTLLSFFHPSHISSNLCLSSHPLSHAHHFRAAH